MTLALITHPQCRRHDMGPGHPEQPARLDAIESALTTQGLAARVTPREAPRAARGAIARAHDTALIARIEALRPGPGELARIDADTAVNAHSFEAALRGAGAAVEAVDLVLDGAHQAAFCAVRPPGHHAERATAMGFCLFNNVAVAALHALEVHGLERVAIVDFDVHFGNGTDDILADDPRVLICQSYQFPLYPLDRDAPGHANTAYFALAPGTGGEAMRRGLESVWLPALAEHAPQLLLFSAGFDAHADDPLAQLRWHEEDYAWLTARLLQATRADTGGRVVSTLEGGYALAALGRSVAAHIGAMTG